MPLSELTDPTAVQAAIEEYDHIGQAQFLEKYGFGPSRSYYLIRNGKSYDSKAIAGAAYGYQFPARGPLSSSELSGGENTVRALLEKLGFTIEVRPEGMPPRITESDIDLIRQSRTRERYAQFAQDEKTAYKHVHEALRSLGELVVEELGGHRDYVLKLTSGFHPDSGIRGGKPKDLWFGVYRKENQNIFLGNPQLFMIVSGRGLEYGFSPLTHPDDFSNQQIKTQTRAIARDVLEQLPKPASPEAAQLSQQLGSSGIWYFRRKQRLDPKISEFRSLDDWLSFEQSDEGIRNAGGGITRYASAEEVGGIDFVVEMGTIARLFRPLMERIVAGAPPASDIERPPESTQQPIAANGPISSFADLFRQFLSAFSEARKGPFQKIGALWETMSALKRRIEEAPAVRERADLLVNISVGQGNWAAVPWIALLNSKITVSTQEGIYVVFLIATELDRIYLTLNQGTTNLVRSLGQREAQKQMVDTAEKIRPIISELSASGFSLDNSISLGANGWLSKNYEIGTIAHYEFRTDAVPSDDHMDRLLDAVLRAYDAAVDVPPPTQPMVERSNGEVPRPEPYGIDDALSELLLEREAVERLLTIWRVKKNLILQGAPGVGKSFVAKRLAYLLLGERDSSRIETVQFHQSYSYEDFVQGYRPDGAGGFVVKDGIFHRFCQKAKVSPERTHVFVIDEINRGNLSKIFGELMLLIEPDKRGETWATTLTYARPDEARFFVPKNVFIIGMMNTADRSLSIVDYALRRRFAFASLEPAFGTTAFRDLLLERGIPEEVITTIVSRMARLNAAIGEDRINLGPGYRIGHSFFIPSEGIEFDPGWCRRIIETEMVPLLQEYWFDDPDKCDTWCAELLRDLP